MIKKIITHPLFSSSALMVIGSHAANGINFVYHFAMGKVLDKPEYGLLGSIFALLYIISIVPISSSFAIVKFISEAKENERQVIYEKIKEFVWKIAFIGLVITLLASPLLANFFHVENVTPVLFVGPSLFLSLILLVDQASMHGSLKFSGVVIPNFILSVTKLIFGLLLVWLGFSVSGAIAGVVLSQIFTYFIVVKMKRKLFSGKLKGKFSIKKFLTYAYPVLIQAIAFTGIFTIDVMLARYFLSADESGIYTALSTLGKIVYFSVQPITATMFPIVTKKRSIGEKYKEVFFLSLLLTVLGGTCITLFYYFFPDLAIGILYKKEYLVAANELVWMGMFMSVYAVSYAIVNFLLSINRVKAAYIPFAGLLLQIVIIFYRHGSILEIIQAGLLSTIIIFLAVSGYLSYISFQKVRVAGAK